MAKLTPKLTQQIQNHYRLNISSYKELSMKFEVSETTIHQALKGIKRTNDTTIKRSIAYTTSIYDTIEIPVKVSVINGKIVHLIPSRINY